VRPQRLLLVNPTIVYKREHLHIGLGTVATYVRQHSAHDARVLDFMVFRRQWREKLAATLAEYRPDLIGFYISTPYFPAAREIAAEIRRLLPGVPILAGGHHPTLSPDEVIGASEFDMLIIGEGEKPTVKLLDTLARGAPLSEVAGLWFRDGESVRKVAKDPLLEAEAIPAVDWSVFDEETLRANFYYWGVLPVMGSRGCPARCSFCSITNVQRLYAGEKFIRFRDPVEVVGEIDQHYERYRELGMRSVYLYDLNFLVNPRWLHAFTEEYRRRGLNHRLPWSAYTRADHVNPETIAALRDSGCVNLRVGIEAANPYMRNVLYEKEVPQHVLVDALRQIKSLGISITGYFMAGGPGERPEWLMESLELAERAGVEFPVFFLYKPLAGTDILERAAELGSHMLEDEMAKGADFLHGVQMQHEHISAWQLQAYLLLTHLLFGPRITLAQLRRSGPRYLLELGRYLRRGVRQGFTPYGALTHFIFYGSDHFSDPPRIPERPRPGAVWRATMAFTRLWMGHSGQPEPELEAAPRPRPIRAEALVPAPALARGPRAS
jgi:anaerobic magnesium-protoporphyrin IX monomethyl ester cyclase